MWTNPAPGPPNYFRDDAVRRALALEGWNEVDTVSNLIDFLARAAGSCDITQALAVAEQVRRVNGYRR